MFFDDHKKALMTIMGKRDAKGQRTAQPTPMKMEVVKHDDGTVDGKHIAMQDFMAAHHEGSPQKMADALSNFLDIHTSMASGDKPGEMEAQ